LSGVVREDEETQRAIGVDEIDAKLKVVLPGKIQQHAQRGVGVVFQRNIGEWEANERQEESGDERLNQGAVRPGSGPAISQC
jgi:hypothetical protein